MSRSIQSLFAQVRELARERGLSCYCKNAPSGSGCALYHAITVIGPALGINIPDDFSRFPTEEEAEPYLVAIFDKLNRRFDKQLPATIIDINDGRRGCLPNPESALTYLEAAVEQALAV